MAAAEEQWREHFPKDPSKEGSDDDRDSEKLLNFFFCNLQLNIGLCSGTLFVTTSSLYFLSDNELEYNIDEDEVATSHYRVSRNPRVQQIQVTAQGSDWNAEPFLPSLLPAWMKRKLPRASTRRNATLGVFFSAFQETAQGLHSNAGPFTPL